MSSNGDNVHTGQFNNHNRTGGYNYSSNAFKLDEEYAEYYDPAEARWGIDNGYFEGDTPPLTKSEVEEMRELFEEGSDEPPALSAVHNMQIADFLNENMLDTNDPNITEEQKIEQERAYYYMTRMLQLDDNQFGEAIDMIYADPDKPNAEDVKSAYVDVKINLPWMQNEPQTVAPQEIAKPLSREDGYVDLKIDLPWMNDKSGAPASPESGTSDSETAPGYDERIEKAQKLRQQSATKLAILGARRQLNPFTRRRIKNEYAEIEAEYMKHDMLVDELQFSKYLDENEDATDADIKAKMVEFGLGEEKSLHAQTKSTIDDKLSSKFINYLNKGTEKQKMAKMALVGVVGSVAIAGLAAATVVTAGGALGGMVAGVAAGGAAGGRVGISGFKAFLRKEGGQGRGASLDDAALKEKLDSSIETLDVQAIRLDPKVALAKLAKERNQDRQARIDTEQKKRRKALGYGAVGAATGAIFGHTIGAYGGDVIDWISDKTSSGGGTAVEAKPAPAVPEGNVPPLPTPEAAPAPTPEMPASTVFDSAQFGEATTIEAGEGWNQTFNELGVANTYDQARLLNDDVLMSKLSNMGVAYVDTNIGGWGINMPANGQMSPEALELIRETARQSNVSLTR